MDSLQKKIFDRMLLVIFYRVQRCLTLAKTAHVFALYVIALHRKCRSNSMLCEQNSYSSNSKRFRSQSDYFWCDTRNLMRFLASSPSLSKGKGLSEINKQSILSFFPFGKRFRRWYVFFKWNRPLSHNDFVFSRLKINE